MIYLTYYIPHPGGICARGDFILQTPAISSEVREFRGGGVFAWGLAARNTLMIVAELMPLALRAKSVCMRRGFLFPNLSNCAEVSVYTLPQSACMCGCVCIFFFFFETEREKERERETQRDRDRE